MSDLYGKATKDIKPDWLKVRIKVGEDYARTSAIVREHGLHTICSSGMCPNKAECWGKFRTATFMILGDVCTRSCKFCATKTGKTLPTDPGEPGRVADSVRLMELKHAVITSVTRDDLEDGGSLHWAEVVSAIRKVNPETTIELLIPDLWAKPELLDIIIESSPDIIGHNIETVERLTPFVRSRAEYRMSLDTIRYISEHGAKAKSGIMVGMGETEEEVLRTFDDLRESGCSIITIGQYLRPTLKHWEVAEYITPEQFDRYRIEADKRGFDHVASGPLVRSSYMAEKAAHKYRK